MPEQCNMSDEKDYSEYSKQLEDDGFKKGSREYESLMALHKYLNETPQEELEKSWKEVEDIGLPDGPTVEEYFASTNPNYMYQKGFTDGATKFKELLEKVINEHILAEEYRFKEIKEGNKDVKVIEPEYTLPRFYKNFVLPLIKHVYEKN